MQRRRYEGKKAPFVAFFVADAERSGAERVRLITAHFVSISTPHHVKTLSRQWRDASEASVMCDVGFFHVTKPPLFMTKQNSNTNHQHIVVVWKWWNNDTKTWSAPEVRQGQHKNTSRRPATDVRCQSRCTRSMDRRRRVALFNNQNVFWSVCRTASNSVLINLRICHRQPSQWQLAACRSSYACLYICCCSSFIRRQLNNGERSNRPWWSLTHWWKDEKQGSDGWSNDGVTPLLHVISTPCMATCGHFFDSHRSSHCFIQKKLRGLDCKCHGNLLAISPWRDGIYYFVSIVAPRSSGWWSDDESIRSTLPMVTLQDTTTSPLVEARNHCARLASE